MSTAHSATPFDVIVIGCGISGLSAAVAAAGKGATVAILERATRDEFGGNTRWTEAYFRMKSDMEVSDDFDELLCANAGDNLDPNVIQSMADAYDDWPPYVKAHGMPDPELLSTLSCQAGPTVQWLKNFGIRFDALPTYFLTAAAPRLMPVGGGLAMIEALHAHATDLGVKFFYETTANRLTRRDANQEMKLELVNGNGDAFELRGRSVVIASGGFEGNPEMLTQYLGPTARYVRPVARGGCYNKGEGIRMALELGAAPAGDFSSFHAEPLDPRSAQVEALVMNFPYGILVNKLGQRFTDEAPGPVDVHYDHIARAIKDQPNGIAYVIYDERIHDVPNWKKGIRTDQPAYSAATLADLAHLCGIDPSELEQTVESFNAACQPGEFVPLAEDHLATNGVRPVKSNWARPLDSAPFHAYPIMPGICFTFGGIKINRDAQVVDADGKAIPGLYAAGEASGLYYQVYTGATSVLRGAVFGRLAGEHAAAQRPVADSSPTI
ncbi:FAD-dependent oxidoreductase [Cupriavidus basilensis]|uniref:FAD-dependent oxidoreductase n=1 Tax=Cupriavidus basilensis TaxID=68895 RepID=UPI0023E7557D|nr:FAD-dependent oxidoreductase [Cupriavidus basilensis]MDF3881298.1 FAD-dependent oxidoreductase [Cupriavidus basilensis]